MFCLQNLTALLRTLDGVLTETLMSPKIPMSVLGDILMKQGCVNPRFEGNVVKLAVLAACCSVELSGFANGRSVAQISASSGQVQIVRGSGSLAAQKGASLEESDAVQTGPGGIVQVKFDDGSSFTLYEKSSLRIDHYKKKQASSDELAESAFQILHGKLRFFINPKAKEKARTQFKSKTAVMGIRGTSGIIDVSPAGITQLVVLTGLVEIKNPKFPSMVVSVAPNFTTQVSPERAPQPPQAISPSEIKGLVPTAAPEAGFMDDGPATTSPSATPKEPDQSGPERGKKPTGSVKPLFAPGAGVVGTSPDSTNKPGVSVAPSSPASGTQGGNGDSKGSSTPASVGRVDGAVQQPQINSSLEIQRELQKVTTTITTTTEKTVEVVREVVAPTIQPTQTPTNPTQKIKVNIGLPRD